VTSYCPCLVWSENAGSYGQGLVHAPSRLCFVRTHTKSPQQYLSDFRNGLLSEQSRKTSERIALTQGVSVRDLQHFIGQSTWPSAPVITRHQHSIAETLGAADGVVLIDESGVVNKAATRSGLRPTIVARSVRWSTAHG
jgi:SRSO17 transposase